MRMNVEKKTSMGQILDCFAFNGIEFTQSHWPEEVISDSYDISYDICEPGVTYCASASYG